MMKNKKKQIDNVELSTLEHFLLEKEFFLYFDKVKRSVNTK